MAMPLLKTNMERLLFAVSRQRFFEEAAETHKGRACRAQRPDTYRKAYGLMVLSLKRVNFWDKVVKYYSAKIEGAVTIKNTMERRNRTEEYYIGPRTIVFSDELAALEFEPTEFEKAEMENEAAYTAAKTNQSIDMIPEGIQSRVMQALTIKED